MSKNGTPFKVLEETIATIGSIGIDKTISALQKARINSPQEDTLNEDFIIGIVCTIFNTSKHNLINGTSKGDRVDGLKACFYLFQKYLNYEQSQIVKYFEKGKTIVSRYLVEVKTILCSENKVDKKNSERILKCEELIMKKIK